MEENKNVGKYLTSLMLLVASLLLIYIINYGLKFFISNYFPTYSSFIVIASQISTTIIIAVFCYLFYKILLSIFVPYTIQTKGREDGEITKLVLRILLFSAIIIATLTIFGISLSGALAGGAVGGIVLGLAVQSVATSILSGFFLSSSKTLLPGDVVVLYSWMLGNSLLCKITRVNLLYTEVLTQNGYSVRISNSILSNSSTFTHVHSKTNGLSSQTFPVTINSDVPVDKLLRKTQVILKGELAKKNFKQPEIYFSSKTGGTNIFTVKIYFNEIDQVNDIQNIVNSCFDQAYWESKK